MRSRRTVGQSEPCSPRRLKQQATSNADSRNIGKISGVLGIRLVGWHPWVQPAGQPPPPEPPAIGNAPGLCVPWPAPRGRSHPRSPSSARLSLPAGAPGGHIPPWPFLAGGWPAPFPAFLGWAFRTSALGGPGMCLQPCRNAAGLVGKSSFLAFHCSLLASVKLSTGGEKQRRLAPVEEY